jgi:hypothetical protein
MLILGLAVLPMASGCYGYFPATRAVYRINGEVSDDGAVQSIVMWIFAIIPVYGVATLADVVVLNLVEYWTGKQVWIGGRAEADGSEYVLEPSDDGREAVLRVSRGGEVVGQARFVKVAEGIFEVRDGDGRLVGQIERTPDGGLSLLDASGETIRTVSAQQLAAVRAE